MFLKGHFAYRIVRTFVSDGLRLRAENELWKTWNVTTGHNRG